jgi:fibronectin-binding autotransporter adhesin
MGSHALRTVAAVVALGLTLGLATRPASANTYTWANLGTTWSAASNWGGTAPGGTDVGQFTTGPSYAFQPALTSTGSIGGIWDTGSGPVTVSGSTLTLNSATINGNAATGIEMDPAAGAMTISSALVLGGSQTWLNNSSNLLSVSGAVGNGGNLLTLAGSSNITVSSAISGNGGLTMNESGLLTLTGVNTYSGGTTISTGTLQIGNGTTNGTLGSGTYGIASGATLLINVNSSGLSPALAYTNLTGAGTLALTSAKATDNGSYNTAALPAGFTGTLQIESGRVYASAPSTLGNATTVIVQAGGSLGVWNGGTFSQNLSLSGTGYGESGYQTAVRMGNSGITTTLSGNVTLTANAAVGAQTGGTGIISGVISGSSTAGFILGASSEAGTIDLTNANTFSGNTTVAYGTLQIGGSGSLGGGSYAGAIGNYGTLAFNTSTNQTLSGVISGNGALAQAGNSQLTLTGTNTYSGATTVSGGTLSANNNNALGTGSVTLSPTGAATLAFSTATPLTGSLASSGTGTSSVVLGTGGSATALTVGSNGSVTTYSGNISQATAGSSLIINGGGLTLAGTSNTYTGGTTVQSGGIAFSSTSSIPSGGAVTVANGAAIGGTAYSAITPVTGLISNLGSFSVSPSAAVAITANSSENITMPGGYPTLSLGSIGNNTYSGTLTPSGSTYYLGGGIGTLFVANTGALTGASSVVINTGIGAVAIGGSNNYTGTTTVVGGTLKLANTASAFGSTGAVTVANGGALDVNGETIEGATPYAFTISGTGAGGGGAIINSTGTRSYLKSVTLAGNATISPNSGEIVLGSNSGTDGTLNLAGYTLTKNGPGTLALNGLSYSGAGNIVINQGTLQLIQDYGVGSYYAVSLTGNGTITVNSGGALSTNSWNLGANAFSITMPIILSGGTLGAGFPAMNGAAYTSPITLAANSTFNFVGGYGSTVSSNISGSGALNINADTSVLSLTGTNNTYTGLATVNVGTVNVYNNQSAANGGWAIGPASASTTTVNFQAGSTVAISSSAGLQVGNNAAANTATQTLNLYGTLNNSGTALLGRTSVTTIQSSGTWNQSGGLTVEGVGGYSAQATVAAGGLLNYVGASPIAVTGAAANSGNATLTIAGTLATPQGFQTVTTPTSGNGIVQMQGGGVLQLTGNVSDLTTIGSGATAKPLFQLLAGGGVVNTNGYSAGLSQNITGAGGLTKTGNGTLNLSGANTFTGITLVSGGVLTLGSSAALAGSTLDTGGPGSLNGAGNTVLTLGGLQGVGNFVMTNTAGTAMPLTVGGNGSNTQFWGNLSDAGLGVAFTKVGAGTLLLAGSNSYSGGTNINAGTLIFANSAALPAAGSVAVANGATVGAGWAIGQSFLSGIAAASLSNTFTVALGVSDANNLDFSSATGGSLAAASLGAYANSTYSGSLTPSGATYRLGGGGATLTFNSMLSGGNSLVVNGPGTVVLNSGLANTYTGGTTITGGLLNINSDTALGTAPSVPATNLTFTGNATLQAGAAGIALSASRGIALTNSAVATFDTNGYGLSVGGAISGAGSLAKIGGGILTLANTETYSGSTTINSGELLLDYTQTTAPVKNIVPSTSALTLAGGTLAVKGSLSLANTQQFSGTTFSAGANSVASSGGTSTVALGAIARSVGATVDFALPTTGSITTTTSNAAPNATILGGYATTGGTTWAVTGSGGGPFAVSGLAAGSYNSVFGANTNVDPSNTGSFTLNSGTTTINSLRFSYAGTATVNIGSGNALAITTGGLLETAGVGANAVTITGGSLMGATNSDLVVIQNNPSSSLLISSTIANNISATALTKSGPGTLYLTTASNSYSGGTFINAGILAVGNNANENVNALGTGTVTINPGATLGFYPGSSGSTFLIPNAIVLNGGKIHQEDGYQHLTGTISVLANSTLEGRWNPKSLWLDGVLSGSGKLTVTDGGNGMWLAFTNGSNTFNGTVAAASNNVVINDYNNTALQYATVDMGATTGSFVLAATNSVPNVVLAGLNGTGASTVKNSGATARTLTINNNSVVANVFNGALGDNTANGDNFGLAKTGNGTLILGGVNYYTGGTIVSGGLLQMANANALGSTSGSLTVSGGILDLNGNSPTLGAVTLASGNILGSNLTLYGASFNVQSGAINPALAGAGALTKTSNGLVTLAGANSYSGGTTVSAGTLQLLPSASLPNNGALTANGGLLDLGGSSPTLTQLSGLNGVITDNSVGAGVTALSVSGGNFSGSIQNGPNKSLALSLVNAGTLVLGGTNNYAGQTTVNDSSALLVNGAHSGGDAYTIGTGSGGTLGGVGTVSGTNAVTFYNNSAIVPGPSTALGAFGTLTLPNLTALGALNANFDLSGTTTAGGGVNDLVRVTGNLSLQGVTTLAVNPTAGTLAAGVPYTLFTYGSLDPASTSSLTLAPGLLGPRQTAVFNYGSLSNSAIELTVNGFNANLVWVGTGSTTWDQNDTSNLPWTGAPTPAGNFFATKDNVTFNNKAVATTVNIAATVNPGSVTVTGTKNFVFTGAGDITNGTSLKVLGPGSLTIGNNNDYTLGTFIQGGGSVILAVDNGLPMAGTVTLGSTGSNGTLDLGGHNQTLGGLAVGAGATPSGQVIGSSGTASASTLTYAGNGTSSFAGTIQDTIGSGNDPLALAVSSGLLNLSGSNTFTGGTTLNGGTLQTGAALTLQNTIVTPAGGALDLGGLNATIGGLTGYGTLSPTNGTLSVGGNTLSSNFYGTLSGSLPLVKVGSGTFTLTGQNNYSGATTVSAGILQITTSSALGGTPRVTVAGGALQLTGGINLPLPLTLAGNGPGGIGAVDSTADADVLSGAVTLSSSARINSDAGTLTLQNGSLTFNNNQLNIGGAGNVTLSSTVAQGSAGWGSIVMDGSGTFSMTNANSYGGPLLVLSGIASLRDGWSGATTTPAITGNVTVAAGATLIFNTHPYSYYVNNTTYLAGTLVVNSDNHCANLTLTGGSTTGNGDLRVGDYYGAGGNYDSTASAATAVIGNTGGLWLFTTGNFNVARGTAPTDLLITVPISASTTNAPTEGIIKSGAGIMELTASNTYNGGTTVNGGLLIMANPAGSSLGTGPVNITSGTLDATQYPQTIGALTVGASGALNINDLYPLSVSGSANFVSGSSIDISTAGIVTPDLLMTYTSSMGTLTKVYVNGVLGLPSGDSLSYSGGSLEVVAAGPPTSTWANSTGGNWSIANNWTPSVPNAQGAVAILGSNLLTSDTVTLDSPQTVGTLVFNNSAAGYTLSGAKLTLDNTGGTAAGSQVMLIAGTHSISAPLMLSNGSLTVTANNSSNLTISGNITDDNGAEGLTLAGDGTGMLILSGANTYGGGTNVLQGTLVIDTASALLDGSSLSVGQGASSLFAPAAGPAAAVSAGGVTAVPEPGAIGLLLAAIWSAFAGYRFSKRPKAKF